MLNRDLASLLPSLLLDGASECYSSLLPSQPSRHRLSHRTTTNQSDRDRRTLSSAAIQSRRRCSDTASIHVLYLAPMATFTLVGHCAQLLRGLLMLTPGFLTQCKAPAMASWFTLQVYGSSTQSDSTTRRDLFFSAGAKPQCVAEPVSGNFFCGIAGAACTSGSDCDSDAPSSKCDTTTMQWQVAILLSPVWLRTERCALCPLLTDKEGHTVLVVWGSLRPRTRLAARVSGR